MRLMIVASKYDVNNKLAGYMVADVEDLKGGKINANFISTANIINTLRSGKVTIDNATIQNGSLVGTNGSLDRYTKLNCNNMIMDGKTPLIVISQIENIGYRLLDVNGKIIKYNNTETIKLVEKYGIANGKLVQPEDSDSYISPIQGQYPITKLNNTLGNGRKSLVGNFGINTSSKNTVNVQEAAKDVNAKIDSANTFNSLTEAQKRVISQYYIWYTTKVYDELTHQKRLNMPKSKVIKLNKLKSGSEWKFAGINNAYLEGNFRAKCELGHPLQYEFLALPITDESENIKIKTYSSSRYHKESYSKYELLTVEQIKDAGAIVFGETCAGDFFDLSKEDLNKLKKVRIIMSDEIALITHIIANNLQVEYNNKARLLYEIVSKLYNRGEEQEVYKVYGETLGKFLLAFNQADIPYPMSLVLNAAEHARKDMFKFLNGIFPERNKVLEILKTYSATFNVKLFYEKDEIIELQKNRGKDSNVIGLSGALYSLLYIMQFTIECSYQYDPINDQVGIRKDIGRYNEDTRRLRASQNKEFRFMCTYDAGTRENRKYLDLMAIGTFLKITEDNIRNAMEILKQYNSEEFKLVKDKCKNIDELRRAVTNNFKSLNLNLEDPDKSEHLQFLSCLNYLHTEDVYRQFNGVYKSFSYYNYDGGLNKLILLKGAGYSGREIQGANFTEYIDICSKAKNVLSPLVLLKNEILNQIERDKRAEELLRQEEERKKQAELERQAKSRLEAEKKAEQDAEQKRLEAEAEQKRQEEERQKAELEKQEQLKKQREEQLKNEDLRFSGLKQLIGLDDNSDLSKMLNSISDYNSMSDTDKFKLNNAYFDLVMSNDSLSSDITNTEQTNKEENKQAKLEEKEQSKSDDKTEEKQEKSEERNEKSEEDAIKEKQNAFNKVKDKVEYIINNYNKDKHKDIFAIYLGYQICLTVSGYKNCSEKQLFRIEKAYEELTKLSKENR